MNENENTTTQNQWDTVKAVHSNTYLPQETRKYQINNLTLHIKQLEKGRNEECQG